MDQTVLQSKTARELLDIIRDLITISKTNTNLAKSYIQRGQDALKQYEDYKDKYRNHVKGPK